MTKNQIEKIISDIMVRDGPDGHANGSGVITDFILALLVGTGSDWAKNYEINGPHLSIMDR